MWSDAVCIRVKKYIVTNHRHYVDYNEQSFKPFKAISNEALNGKIIISQS